MCDRDAFLAAILAAPADDLPRLIFADWLDEHGDADRAEFIRLQCAAARGDLAARSIAATRRQAVLAKTHRDEWLGPLARAVYSAEYRRGFAEHAVLPAAVFLREGPALRRLTPLRSVALLGAGRVLPALLDGPHLRGLTALHLTGARLGNEGIGLLAAAPALAGLRTLRLGQNDLGNAAAAALAHSPHLGTLTTLVLDRNAIGDTGAGHLARSRNLTRLTTLSLAANEIGPNGEAALRGSRALAALAHLDLSDQRVPSGRWLVPVAAK
jgi:uncharacterized protein (TIGR02996 family)